MFSRFKRLPKTMFPSQEDFENLGFIFEETKDDNMYKTTLPKGWKIIANTSSNLYSIYDTNNTKRAVTYIDEELETIFMRLLTRYQIQKKDNQDYIELSFVDTLTKEVIIIAKYLPNDEKSELIYNSSIKQYADKNFPYWENPTLYWNEEHKKRIRK